MNPATIHVIATSIFAIAIMHTFLSGQFEKIAHKFSKGSIGSELFHLLGEVGVIFGFWAAILCVFFIILKGRHYTIEFLETLDFTEPAFVFVIMAMAGTRPIIRFTEELIISVLKILPFPRKMAFYVSALVMGPLLGSFITEPAAMTVSALILNKNFFSKPDMSMKLKYATIGLLFVNISIGGTLTHFAAPPVIMVASKWGWGISHMFGSFGYKAAISVIVGTLFIAFLNRKELSGDFELGKDDETKMHPSWWIILIHILFLAFVVVTGHHMVAFLGIFLCFIGFTTVTKKYQDLLKIKESLLVGFFLGGLVILGSMQKWWLQPLLTSLPDSFLYFDAIGLTAITDNAVLTYLASLVDISESQKYYLVAGAVTGGGLTVIANAPNPVGFGILKESFGEDGISPIGLFISAIFPTCLAFVAFRFLASI